MLQDLPANPDHPPTQTTAAQSALPSRATAADAAERSCNPGKRKADDRAVLHQVLQKVEALLAESRDTREQLTKLQEMLQPQSQELAAIRQLQQEQATELQQLQAAQATHDARLQQETQHSLEVDSRCDWLQTSFQMQLEAADRRRRQELADVVVLKPAKSFTSGPVAFGRLDAAALTAELRKVVTVPEGSTCTILRRFCERPPAPGPNLPRPPAPVYQAEQDCKVDRVEVRLPAGVSGKELCGNRKLRNKFEQHTHMLVAPALTEMEQQEKQHLQKHAMQPLIHRGVFPGWRRSKITWKVPGTERFGVLSIGDIRIGCTPGFVLRQWVKTSQFAAPGAEVCLPGGPSRGDHGGSADASMA